MLGSICYSSPLQDGCVASRVAFNIGLVYDSVGDAAIPTEIYIVVTGLIRWMDMSTCAMLHEASAASKIPSLASSTA